MTLMEEDSEAAVREEREYLALRDGHNWSQLP